MYIPAELCSNVFMILQRKTIDFLTALHRAKLYWEVTDAMLQLAIHSLAG